MATAYWSGVASKSAGDIQNNWGTGSTNSNWSSNAAGTVDAQQVPGPITDVVFTAANATPTTGNTLATQLDAPYAIKGLTIAVPATSGSGQITSTVIKPNGYALTIGSDGLTLAASSSSAVQFTTGSILLATSESWANNSSSQGLTVASGISPASGPGLTTLTFNGSGTGGISLNGPLSDGAGQLAVVFNQAGVTQLNGANTFTGGLTISSGSVQLGNAAALNASNPEAVTFGAGSGNLAVLEVNGNNVSVSSLYTDGTVQAIAKDGGATAGTLTVNNAAADTFSGTLQNGGAALTLVKAGSAILTLTGSNTYSGGTNVAAGILNFAAGTLPLSGIGFSGGTLQWSSGNSQDISSGFAPIAAGQFAILDTNGNNVSFASPLGGSGGLTKVGAGMLTLLGSNTYSGTTTVSNGTVQVGSGGAAGTLGSGNVVNGSVLVFDRSDNFTANNNISGVGPLYQIGSGTLVLAGVNSGLGPVTVTGSGALTIAGSTSTGTAGQITVGANAGNSNVLNLGPGAVLNANETAAPPSSRETPRAPAARSTSPAER